MHATKRALASLVTVAVLAGTAADVGAEAGATRAAMQVIFENMRFLLAASASEQSFDDPANVDNILTALREVGDQAAMVAEHADGTAVGATFLASALDRYMGWAQRSFEWGQPEAARHLVLEATDACIACHTRLPDDLDRPLGEDFVAGEVIERFPPIERARLEMATRRFESARATLSTLLDGRRLDTRLAREAIVAHLTIDLRVRDQPRRSVELLARFSRRGDLDPALSRDVTRWLTALRGLDAERLRHGDLDSARALLGSGEPTLVEAIAASGILNRLLERHRLAGADLAEGYYLLGTAEAMLGDGFVLPTAELYLESAILTAPDAPAARRAYERLFSRMQERYRGEAMPEDVDAHLRKLRGMLPATT